MTNNPADNHLIELRAEWLAACDRLEFAQDTGRTKAEMLKLASECTDAYLAYQKALS